MKNFIMIGAAGYSTRGMKAIETGNNLIAI